MKLSFKTTNNEAEYEALLTELAKAEALGQKGIDIKVDSQVSVNQVMGEHMEKDEKLKNNTCSRYERSVINSSLQH